MKLKRIVNICLGIYQKEYLDGDVLYLQVKDFSAIYFEYGSLKPSNS